MRIGAAMITAGIVGMGVYYVRDQHDGVMSSTSYSMSRQLLLSDNVLRPIIAPKGTLTDQEFVAMTGTHSLLLLSKCICRLE
jgi:hypothetical protein